MECSPYYMEMHCGHILLYNIIPKYSTKNLAVLYVEGKEWTQGFCHTNEGPTKGGSRAWDSNFQCSPVWDGYSSNKPIDFCTIVIHPRGEQAPWVQCSFFVKFCHISTWKVWFWPIQRIFHGKNGPNLPDFKKIKSESPEFCDKFQ